MPPSTSHSSPGGDQLLVAGLRRGDPAVLEGLVDRHHDELVRYAASVLSNWDAAADIVQETFIRLWERRETWTGEASLRGLLFRITRNLALDELRRTDRRSTLLAADPPPGPRLTSPTEAVRYSELESAYRAALRALPERRREVFILSRQHGLSYREIAESLSISPQTVANQLSAALATLRDALEPFIEPT